MRIEVVCALPGEARVATVELAPGATARDAVAAAGFPPAGNLGVFGKRVRPDFEDGVRNQLVLEAIEKSAASRRWVAVPAL